jgi:hypothetical protein
MANDGDSGDMAGKRTINLEYARLVPVKLAFNKLHASLLSGLPRHVVLPVVQAQDSSMLLTSFCSVIEVGSRDGAPSKPCQPPRRVISSTISS